MLANQKAIKNGSTTLLDLSYDYNRNNSVGTLNGKTGHLTKITDNLNTAKNREYEFDALGRLTVAKGKATSQWTQTYVYDRFGNRTSVTATGTAADNTPMPRDGLAAAQANNSLIIKNFASTAEKTTPIWQDFLRGISAAGPISNSFASSRKSNSAGSSKLCNIIQGMLKPFSAIFAKLWTETQAGTANATERGGLIGHPSNGEVIAGVGEPPAFRQYSGPADHRSMSGFSPWARSQISSSRGQIDFIFWVHTHPNGGTTPSGANGDLGVAAPYRITGRGLQVPGVGLDGIIITSNKVVVFNEVGKYCEFAR